VAAIISGRPAAAGFKKYVMRFKDSPYIKGLRDILFEKPRGYCLDAKFIAGVRLLGELGLSFDVETPPDRLADAEKLIAACPDTCFVVDHCGNPDLQSKDHSQWRRETAAIARRKNAVVKISGILTSAKKGEWGPEDLMPHINHLREVFGPDRLMYGSDWPVVTMKATYQQWMSALRTAVRDWPQKDQRKLFHDNAVSVFGLA
jgi:predicted TIM-barrel fold metal-dependent hydrolase